MLPNITTVLKKFRPVNLRRKSLRTMWMVLVSLTCVSYIVENLMCTFSQPDRHDTTGHHQRIHADALTRGERKFKASHALLSIHPTNAPSDKKYVKILERASKTKSTLGDIQVHNEDDAYLGAPRHRQCIVLYSSRGCDVSHLSRISGWGVIVVGKPPTNCRNPSCTYLNAAKIKSLKFSITKHLPSVSESRRMIGYLYAISRGAKVIYDTQCGIVPKFRKVDFITSGNATGIVATSGSTFNPYGHFGYPMLYPRGFPGSGRKVKDHSYRIINMEVPMIQQGQINFVLGKGDAWKVFINKNKNITFDRSSPPVMLSSDIFGPVNSMNTLYLYKALWTLMFPALATSDSDITRGYIAQRLVSEVGGATGFLPPTAYCLSHDNGQSRFAGNRVNPNMDKLITFLKQWKCEAKLQAFACGGSLISTLVKHGFLLSKDLKLFQSWISDLKIIGYSQPARKKTTTFHSISVRSSQWNPRVMYGSSRKIPSRLWLSGESVPSPLLSSVFKPMYQTCGKKTYKLTDWLTAPITDIMLIVIFNYEFLYKNLPYMEYTHRPYFRHILYCGPSFEGFDKILMATKMDHIIYVDGVDKDTWFFTYKCLIHAASMKLNVKGYLYIGDDILLNTWNFHDLPRDKFWMPMSMTYVNRNQPQHPWWYYWTKPVGRKAANGALNEILDSSLKNSSDSISVAFVKMYQKNIGMDKVIHRSIDVFYAPAIYNEEIVKIGKIFRRHNTILGLAIPMLHAGLVQLEDVVPLKGQSLWKEDRSAVVSAFKAGNHYLHPFKAGKDLLEKKGRSFFCDKFLPLAHAKLTQIKASIVKNRRKQYYVKQLQ